MQNLLFFPFLSYSLTSVANQAIKLITIFSFHMPYLGRQGRGSSLKVCLSLQETPPAKAITFLSIQTVSY